MRSSQAGKIGWEGRGSSSGPGSESDCKGVEATEQDQLRELLVVCVADMT